MLHVGIDVEQGTKENVYVACLRVLFGDRAIEAVLRSHGKSEAVNEKFAFLLVALGSVTFQAVGNVAKIGFPVAIIG